MTDYLYLSQGKGQNATPYLYVMLCIMYLIYVSTLWQCRSRVMNTGTRVRNGVDWWVSPCLNLTSNISE